MVAWCRGWHGWLVMAEVQMRGDGSDWGADDRGVGVGVMQERLVTRV